MSDWSCSNCGRSLEVADELPSSIRHPCPDCGSTTRTAHGSITERLSLVDHMKMHFKHREGGNKVVREEYAGDDLYRKTGKWSIMHRLIDRANNWYEETFRDRETGEVIDKKAEPLTEHRRPPKSN
jgi:hypothetical protein